MSTAKAQISMEYMIITGFILVAILIPTFILLFSTTNKSVYGSINLQKVEDLNLGLLNDAKQMYYLGLYSNKIVDYNMPKNVENFYILEINKTVSPINPGDPFVNKKEYYIGITLINGKETRTLNFPSDIPIISKISNDVIINNSLSSYVSACQVPYSVSLGVTSCTFYSFTGTTIMSGKKRFKVETVYDNDRAMVISEIYPFK